jgi:hypothetical protein
LSELSQEDVEMMRNAALESDKKDLVGILHDRFGHMTEGVKQKILEVQDLDVMDRLFVVAVNAANWEIFVKELYEGKDSFKIIGEDFNPLAEIQKKKDA